MATRSSILAWKIPRTEKPGGLQSMRSQRVGHDWATNTQTQSTRINCTTQGIEPIFYNNCKWSITFKKKSVVLTAASASQGPTTESKTLGVGTASGFSQVLQILTRTWEPLKASKRLPLLSPPPVSVCRGLCAQTQTALWLQPFRTTEGGETTTCEVNIQIKSKIQIRTWWWAPLSISKASLTLSNIRPPQDTTMYSSPLPSPRWRSLVCLLYLWVCFSFVIFTSLLYYFRFHL